MSEGQPLKVVIIGDGAIGKTSFLIPETPNMFPGQNVSTALDTYILEFNYEDKSYKIGLWDTSGNNFDNLKI